MVIAHQPRRQQARRRLRRQAVFGEAGGKHRPLAGDHVVAMEEERGANVGGEPVDRRHHRLVHGSDRLQQAQHALAGRAAFGGGAEFGRVVPDCENARAAGEQDGVDARAAFGERDQIRGRLTHLRRQGVLRLDTIEADDLNPLVDLTDHMVVHLAFPPGATAVLREITVRRWPAPRRPLAATLRPPLSRFARG